MIKPKRGDLMSYTDYDGEQMPALITKVLGESCVNLVAVDQYGRVSHPVTVEIVSADNEGNADYIKPEVDFCEMLPT